MSTARRNQQTDMSSMLEEAYETPRELVQEYPLSSTLLAFGIGVGVGVLIGHSIGNALKQPSDSQMSKMSGFAGQLCESIKSSVTEALHKAIPR